MTQAKHTPGPWESGGNCVFAITGSGIFSQGKELPVNRICIQIMRGHKCSEDELKATVAVVKHVPDMLDALRQWPSAELTHDEQELRNARNARDAAIAKVVG